MEAHVWCTRVWREYGTRVNIPSEERETDTLLEIRQIFGRALNPQSIKYTSPVFARTVTKQTFLGMLSIFEPMPAIWRRTKGLKLN